MSLEFQTKITCLSPKIRINTYNLFQNHLSSNLKIVSTFYIPCLNIACTFKYAAQKVRIALSLSPDLESKVSRMLSLISVCKCCAKFEMKIQNTVKLRFRQLSIQAKPRFRQQFAADRFFNHTNAPPLHLRHLGSATPSRSLAQKCPQKVK